MYSGVSLFSGVLMSWGVPAGTVQEGHKWEEDFLKEGLKQGILVHSEQIVKVEGGHWIYPLCTTVLKFEHESVIWTF